jgi:hypothetical protein
MGRYLPNWFTVSTTWEETQRSAVFGKHKGGNDQKWAAHHHTVHTYEALVGRYTMWRWPIARDVWIKQPNLRERGINRLDCCCWYRLWHVNQKLSSLTLFTNVDQFPIKFLIAQRRPSKHQHWYDTIHWVFQCLSTGRHRSTVTNCHLSIHPHTLVDIITKPVPFNTVFSIFNYFNSHQHTHINIRF